MNVSHCFAAVVVGLASFAFSAHPSQIVPAPVSVELTEGAEVLTFTADVFKMSLPADMKHSTVMKAMRLLNESRRLGQIQFLLPGAEVAHQLAYRFDASLPDEGYRLTATSKDVTIHAKDDAGCFYGTQTFLQLLAPGAEKGTYTVTPCVITDAPRFKWRGLMVDDCRHFFGKDAIKTVIREMSAVKLNRLHWHLTEDQGWRIEINAYPKLTTIGATRKQSPKKGNRGQGDGTPYGPYFYTQADIAEVVRYAEQHCVTVVPEFDMPGHGCAAIAAYPELSCRKQPKEVRTIWGVEEDVYCLGSKETLTFMDTVVGEMLALFPGPYFHIGGDEAPHKRWEECPACQALMANDGLKKATDLQAWLVRRMSKHLAAAGRQPVIWWEDCMQGAIPTDVVVFCWRAQPSVDKVSAQGNPIVITYPYYLDYGQFPKSDGYEYMYGLVTSEHVYKANPLRGVTPGKEDTVIGVQGNAWAECIWTPEEQIWKMFPRAIALAETAWSPESKRNWEDFKPRAEHYTKGMMLTRGVKAAPLELK